MGHSRKEEHFQSESHSCVQSDDSHDEQSAHLVVCLVLSMRPAGVDTHHDQDGVYILHPRESAVYEMKVSRNTNKKKPELTAPAPTSAHRKMPTGIRHSKLIGMYTLIPYP